MYDVCTYVYIYITYTYTYYVVWIYYEYYIQGRSVPFVIMSSSNMKKKGRQWRETGGYSFYWAPPSSLFFGQPKCQQGAN